MTRIRMAAIGAAVLLAVGFGGLLADDTNAPVLVVAIATCDGTNYHRANPQTAQWAVTQLQRQRDEVIELNKKLKTTQLKVPDYVWLTNVPPEKLSR